MTLLHSSLVALSFGTVVFAAHIARTPAVQRDSTVSTLSASQLAAFAPFTQFARAAYCPSSKITNWQCGQACNALPGFQPTLTGGDGNAIQLFFVGYWPQKNSVVVAHEGTDPLKLQSVLTDLNLGKTNLDPALFPGLPDGIEVAKGFTEEHAKTATQILGEVKNLLGKHAGASVTLAGHSLGGALSEMEAVFMKLNLPAGTAIKAVTYGTPRVGNAAWAQFVDAQVPDYTRINNENDVIPILPGRFLGFQHPHGEVHILSPGHAVSCPGDEDATDSQCTIKSTPNILDGNVVEHLGPYEGILIGTLACF
ncbi:alpha/beta-hydrolase [Auriscalpium vulgare]|uniref:Alpha/beta-hydrolase n=1 Tax=Auriscalpium vulgare TaxID=40419 RepID=A0ACB8RDZ6_9AGAM|nr:alpha/beta-hydrolase [Auriscalpium vulgare]